LTRLALRGIMQRRVAELMVRPPEQAMATSDVWSDFFDASTHNTRPPLTDAIVASAERAPGYVLPASCLQLFRVKNGGCPRRQCYPTGGTHWSDNHVRIATVFGIGGGSIPRSPARGT
jgi:hypothetical protein